MSVSNEVLLDVQGLEKAYGGNQVLNGITTQIRRGEVVAIIGPSGCGKSTFLRSLNLLEEPTGGKILFEGTDITDSKVDINRHRQKIGMVFQQFNLFPHKTVKENILLAPVTLKLMTPEEAEKKAMELLTRVGLPDKADAYPGSLSGGQKQRIAIARTLLKDNNILIFDDSLSAVDTETDAQIRAALRHEQKDVTTLIISHRVTTLSQADLILVLENGQITQQGTHAELCSQPGLYQRINSIQNALEEELTQAKAAEGVN